MVAQSQWVDRVDAAAKKHSGPQWLVGDLAELDLASKGIAEGFDEFFTDANVVGLTPLFKIATWDMRPLADDSKFLVAVLAKSQG